MTSPTDRQTEMLRRAAKNSPWQILESHDVLGIGFPDISAHGKTEEKALADPDLLECERQGWLLRRVETIREPPIWWVLTNSGRATIGIELDQPADLELLHAVIKNPGKFYYRKSH